MHFLIRKNKKGTWVIAYEFNFYAPRAGAINIYALNKLRSFVDYALIEPISGEPVHLLLKKFRDIKKIQMRVHSGADLSGLSGLPEALKALKRIQDGIYIDIGFSVGRGRDKVLSGNMIDDIPGYFKTMGLHTGIENFFLTGTRIDTGQREEVNLMDIVLKERKTVGKIDKDYRFIDPKSMYAALAEAYNTQRYVIDRV
jgi:hypothetical protein